MNWYHGAVLDKNTQRRTVVVAFTAKAARELLEKVGFRVSAGEFRKYWNKAIPRVYDNLTADISVGVYLATDMNYGGEGYKLYE